MFRFCLAEEDGRGDELTPVVANHWHCSLGEFVAGPGAVGGSRVRCTASISARHVFDATVVVEEKAGATPLAKRESLAATGAPWLAPRLKWTRSTEATTLPDDAVALPGGVSIACVDRDGATNVVVRADDVSLTRSYDASGALVAISLHAPSPQDGAD